MKTKNLLQLIKLLIVVCLFISFSNSGFSQTEPVKASPDTTVTKKDKDKDEGKNDKKKRKDEFIVYVGANFNKLSVSSDVYEATMKTGYQIGFDYKRGKFFYWQVGLRFNNAVYGLKTVPGSGDSVVVESNFAIRDLDIPITGGINFLSAINRIVALRLFVSAVPAFNLSVGDNDLGIKKDNINSFVMYGQAGLGVNVAFVVLEFGYNYGFNDILQDHQSKPGQIFVNLGFRF
jgi:hypothetical protein